MPIYDFSCPKCQHREERIVPSSRQAVTCPKCKSAMLREISAHGGYKILGNNGASTFRRQSGSFKKPK